MFNLFIALQLDRHFKRQVTLLKILGSSKDYISITELTAISSLSYPTLKKEIDELSDSLKDFISIHFHKSSGYILSFNKDVSLDQLINQLAYQTVVYQVIHSIFHNKSYSLQNMLDLLSISRTSFLRAIHHMNEILQHFQISIQSNPLSFVGEETNIRIMLYGFYASFSDSAIILDSHDENLAIYNSFRQKVTSRPLYFNHFRMSLWFSIMLVRWRNKQFVRLKNNMDEQIIERDVFRIYKEDITAFYNKKFIGASLPYDEVLWFYFSTLATISYSSPFALSDKKYQYRYRQEAREEVLQEISTFIHKLFPDLSLTDEPYIRIEAYLVNMRLLSMITPQSEIIQPDIVDYMKKQYPEIFHICYGLLTELQHDSKELHFHHIEYITASIITIYTSLKSQELKQTKHVLLAIHGPSGFDEYIINRIRGILLPLSPIEFYSETSLFFKEIDVNHMDFIICNYDLHLPKDVACELIRIANIPTEVDWNHLHQISLDYNR